MKRWNISAGLGRDLVLYCSNTRTSRKKAVVPAPAVPLMYKVDKGSEHPSSSWNNLRGQPRLPAGMQSSQLSHTVRP